MRAYYYLAKPGIIYGNLMIAVSGFLLAATYGRHFELEPLAGLATGMFLVIGSACVFNNYLDRDIDKKMARTKRRALVSGKISGPSALVYGAALGLAGFLILILLTSAQVVWLNLIAYVSYVLIYDFAKRRTVFSTIIGTVPGAIPPAAGYAALNRLDGAALIYFLAMVFWQLAHFYSISLYRQQDYAEAGLPVMSVRYGPRATKFQIMASIVLFGAAGLSFSIFGYAGFSAGLLLAALAVYWFWKGIRFKDKAPVWGKRMFLTSLIVLMGLAILAPLGPLLP